MYNSIRNIQCSTKGFTMKFWQKITVPSWRKVSLFLAEVVSYAGLTAISIRPDWFSWFTMAGFFVVLFLVLSPFMCHAAKVSPTGDSGFLLCLRLTAVLALPLLVSTAIKGSIEADVPRLFWMTFAFALTSLCSRRCRKKLPGV